MRQHPSTWAKTDLGNLIEYVTSGSRDWSKYYAEAGVLFVRTQDINTNKLAEPSSIAKVCLPASVEGKRTLIRKGDLLITITGANVGRCAHVTAELPEAYVSQSVALVRLRDPSLGRFVHLQLLAPSESSGKTSLEARAYGMGRPVLNLDNVRETPLLIPPRQEQQRITRKLESVLARLDAVNTSLARVASIVKRFRRSVLAAAISGRLTEEWREAEGAGEPRSLGELVSCISGSGFPPAMQGRPEGDLPFAKVSDISSAVLNNYGLIESAVHYVSNLEATAIRAKVIPIGSTVFAKIGEGLKLNRRAKTTRPLLIDNNCMALVPNESKILPDYLYLLMRTVDLGQFAIATAVPSVRKADIESIAVHLPSLGEQCEVVRRVDSLLAFADRLESRLQGMKATAERLTPALLAKAFRGELVPQDKNDEPASELLRRLQAEPPGRTSTRARKAAV